MNLNAVAIAAQARVPVLLWGEPGIGKTAKVAALAEAMGWAVETVIASLREPSDFAGLPVVVDGDVRLATPTWAKRAKATAGRSMVFFDELSTAAPATQAALLRVIHEGVVGDEALGDVAFVAAANPADCAAGGWDLSPPLANRFVHLEMRADAHEWADWAIGYRSAASVPVLPDGWRAAIAGSRARVAGFVRARPALLMQLPASEASRAGAWPSPRTWDMVATLRAACGAVSADEETQALLLSGAVGTGAAMELLAWERAADLPDPEEVLAAASDFRVPERGDIAFAVLGGVVAAVASKLTEERWRAGWRVLAKAASQGSADVAAAAARSLQQAGEGKMNLAAVIKDVAAFAPLFAATQQR